MSFLQLSVLHTIEHKILKLIRFAEMKVQGDHKQQKSAYTIQHIETGSQKWGRMVDGSWNDQQSDTKERKFDSHSRSVYMNTHEEKAPTSASVAEVNQIKMNTEIQALNND